MQYLTNIDLSKNELQNAVIENLSVAPSNPKKGQMYFDTVANLMKVYNGTEWESAGGVTNWGAIAEKPFSTIGDGLSVVDDALVADGIPTVTIAASQVIGQNPVKAQLTNEQAEIVESNHVVHLNIEQLSNGTITLIKSTGEGGTMLFGLSGLGGITYSQPFFYDEENKQVTYYGAKKIATAASLEDYVKLDGTVAMAGSLQMGHHKIRHMDDGIDESDGATYGQVTSALDEAEGYTDTALEDYTTTEDLNTLLDEKADAADLADYLKLDGTSAMTGDLAMGGHKITGLVDGSAETDAATVGQMQDAIDEAVADYLPLGGGTMTGTINMGANAITNIPDATADTSPVAYGQLPTTPVITAATLSYNGDTVKLQRSLLNVKTGATSSSEEVVTLANSTTAGLMSPASVNAISNLTSRVESLEGRTVRLLYTTKDNPSAAEIEAFVRAEGYTDPTKWAGIAVVVAGTYHIWHYYSSGTAAWRDDGLDTVSQFTNEIAGIIKGSEEDGQIYAEDDGTGSVVGWDALKARVTDVEENKADQSDVDAIPVVKSVSGTLAASQTSVAVAYTGTVINAFVKDGNGKEVITDVSVGSSSVTFSIAQAISTALTCTVIYM